MKKSKTAVPWKLIVVLAFLSFVGLKGYSFYTKKVHQQKILKQIIQRLKADSRIAEVLVTKVEFNPITQKHMTTIKFLEYDSRGEPLAPKFFTFSGNVIQFQSLVVRFEDVYVEQADDLKGRSAYLFWKVFMLDGKNTQEYVIAPVDEVPAGYKIEGELSEFEENLWRDFWDYALYSDRALSQGIKNAQIEAPGSKFIPGILYTLRIEHDGGIRIDTQKIPEILKGEQL